MDTTISRFRVGHRNANRLLNVFTRQLGAFEHGRTPDMLLVRDIVDCLNRYAAAGSRALETALIDDLTHADGDFAATRLVLTTEHGVITELGKHCLDRIEDIIAGTLLTRSKLLTPAQRYVRMYRNHLRRERLYLRRHERGTVGEGKRRRQLPAEPLADFPDLRDRIARATAWRSFDESGQPVCPACAVDAVVASEYTSPERAC